MLKQSLQQKLLQKLTPQQIQLMKLIQLPTLDFEQRVKQEIEDNPALEAGPDENPDDAELTMSGRDDYKDEGDNEEKLFDEKDLEQYLNMDDTPDYKMYAPRAVDDEDESYKMTLAAGKTFREYLLEQLASFNLNETEQKIAEYIIGNLDNAGYLRREMLEIADDLAFNESLLVDESDVERILRNVIWLLDPPGIGARNLQESLILQLKRKEPTPARKIALRILERYFHELTHKHYKKIINSLKIDEETLKEALNEITKLNPKPGGSYSGQRITTQIIPDFKVRIEEDAEGNKYPVIELNQRNLPELHVSRHYKEMLEGYKLEKNKTKAQRDAITFIKQKLDSANWFIDAVKQRYNTLEKTIRAIVDYQKEYFLTGDERKIRPMILKDIAEKIDMDISTVSRVANSKYVDTPYGTKLLKEFFSEGMETLQGEEVSTIRIKEILKEIVDKENKKKPLTDEQLTKALKEQGYKVARRTVAKYRDQLGIPPARLRKEL
ncbi:MAG: RNA polymerase factor sigma-54 [Chlorobi bacterium]|nr:RNA polymerase factor sigma-54 [Chlorobiota bacterium]